MASHRLRQAAEEDLLSIWGYRAESSRASATALMRSLHRQFLQLAE